MTNHQSELHIIIDWGCDYTKSEFEIELTESSTLKMIEMIQINIKKEKSKPSFSKILSLAERHHIKHINDFNVFIISDECPQYFFRETHSGRIRKVNVNIYDLKTTLYRLMLGNITLSCTKNTTDTREYMELFGIYDKYYKIKNFSSLKEVFDELNKSSYLEWLVMRDFEDMPYNINIDKNLCVKLLVNNYFLVKSILGATSATDNMFDHGGTGIRNYVNINNQKILFDFRTYEAHDVDHYYYCTPIQKKMLNTRIWHPNGFYIPNKEMHLHTLIYNSIIHEKHISTKNEQIFKRYGINPSKINQKDLKTILDKWMRKDFYCYCDPEPPESF
tara:strand:- start:1128 stop:2123 length:996 start_codon:yes stop_codon:yes gene_type:complete